MNDHQASKGFAPPDIYSSFMGTQLFQTRRSQYLVWLNSVASIALLFVVFSTKAGTPTVWTGPKITFTKNAFADPALAANQDRITSIVWITRGSSQGIYNAKTETGFVHNFSPDDTEWANGTTDNYNSLSYTDWNSWAKAINGGPPSTVGINAVLHLKTDNIYIDIKFTSWDGGVPGGGFSYIRSTAAVEPAPPPVEIVNPKFQQGVFDFSFLTQTGYVYTVEFATNLNPVNWFTLTSFPGDGATAHVSDSTATNSTRYYRVGAAH